MLAIPATSQLVRSRLLSVRFGHILSSNGAFMLEVGISPLKLRARTLDARRGPVTRLSCPQVGAKGRRPRPLERRHFVTCQPFALAFQAVLEEPWARVGHPKNRKMKEGPTMLLIIKEMFWEPTVFMKTNLLVDTTSYVYEKNG